MDLSLAILLFLLTGALTGILSGLLGIGGGLVIVPILLLLLDHNHFPPEHLMHVALGTSLATIIFTSLASARAHHGHGNVDWRIVASLAPGIVAGTLAGAWLAAHLHTDSLKIVFVLFVFYIGTQLLLDFKPAPSRTLPGSAATFLTGGGIGIMSSLVGIGGGTMTVPFLVWCNHPMRRAVGTSAAVGFPIALAGTVGYAINGMDVAGLPPYSLGFVYLPAVAGIVASSMFTAPLGAKLAQVLPVPLLKKFFALLLYGLGIKMLTGI